MQWTKGVLREKLLYRTSFMFQQLVNYQLRPTNSINVS